MKRVATPMVVTALLAFGGCTGMVTDFDPDQTVKTLLLQADLANNAALVAKDCVDARGLGKTMRTIDGVEQETFACNRLPNEFGCEVMEVDIKADGRTAVTCSFEGKILETDKGQPLNKRFLSFAEGSPLVCTARADFGCQICKDKYGETVVENCTEDGRGAQTYRRSNSGWNQPDEIPGFSIPAAAHNLGGTANPENATPTTPENPGDTPGTQQTTPEFPGTAQIKPPQYGFAKCDPRNAVLQFQNSLNRILQMEGLNFSWVANPNQFNSGQAFGFWNAFDSRGDGSCVGGTEYPDYPGFGNSNCTVDSNLGGVFGLLTGLGSGQKCRCGRITTAALRDSCAGIPQDCLYQAQNWDAQISMAYGQATRWLFNGAPGRGPTNTTLSTIPTPGGVNGIPPNGDTIPPSGNNIPPGTGIPPNCLGSPLVLDMAGNGIAPTAADKGVKFDVSGFGATKTAWVKGDDALLVLDRNSNGVIDGAAELFGDATIAGVDNGFDALAALDRPSDGGNGNGILEADDLMYGELRVWSDKNGDGVSQSHELSTLADAGIASLSLAFDRGHAYDESGNDLGLKGSFTRTDGRTGQMIDVFFASGN